MITWKGDKYHKYGYVDDVCIFEYVNLDIRKLYVKESINMTLCYEVESFGYAKKIAEAIITNNAKKAHWKIIWLEEREEGIPYESLDIKSNIELVNMAKILESRGKHILPPIT